MPNVEGKFKMNENNSINSTSGSWAQNIFAVTLIVEDLESTNGTQVNGERVSRAVLRTGDTLTVGRVNFNVLPG